MDIIGQRLQLVHKTYTIVGVMPPLFTWQGGDVYLPLKLAEARDQYFFTSLRLKDGVRYESTNAELQPIMEVMAKRRHPSAILIRSECSSRG